jgi:endonuclease YncB( thermonuclease family)
MERSGHGESEGETGGRCLLTAIVGWAMAVATLFFAAPSLAAEVVTVPHDQITVVSGDTIRIKGDVYRLAGIVAPKPGQQCRRHGDTWPCGLAAADTLRKFLTLETHPVTCVVQPAQRPPPVATCIVGDEEISILMLRSGYVAAVADAAPYYLAAEDRARQASLGIWSGTVPPSLNQRSQGAPAAPPAEVLSLHGSDVTVIDGDSIQIGDGVYRLAGIDAPELGQACEESGHLSPCGLNAAFELRKLFQLERGPITCYVRRAEASPVATCMVHDRDISALMLKGGYVTAVAGGSPHYAAAEHLAQKAGLGIWSGPFIPPREWREGRRLAAEGKAGDAACRIKGIVTEGGERLYYGPLDDAYDSMKVDPRRGERLFCSDDEARRAGWTRKGEKPPGQR